MSESDDPLLLNGLLDTDLELIDLPATFFAFKMNVTLESFRSSA